MRKRFFFSFFATVGVALFVVFAVVCAVAFAGCGGRIAFIPPDDAGDAAVDAIPAAAVVAPDANLPSDGGVDASLPRDGGDGGRPRDAGIDADLGDAPWDGRCEDFSEDAANGGPSDAYPAFAANGPRVVNLGGSVMMHPILVAITFDVDPLRPAIEDFISKIGASSYWTPLASEYGIARPINVIPVHVNEPFVNRPTKGQIMGWLADKLDGTHPEFPAPTPDTLYVVYLPPNVDAPTYHWQTQGSSSPPEVSYVVVPTASGDIDSVTQGSSREIVAAISDPLPFIDPALAQSDPDDSFWGYMYGVVEANRAGNPLLVEVTDPCSTTTFQHQGIPFLPADLGYSVEKFWSNAASFGGHNPCVPAPDPSVEPYFNVAANLQDDVTIVFNPNATPPVEFTTKSYNVNVKRCRILELDVFSDGPTNGPITLSVDQTTSDFFVAMSGPRPGKLSVSLDRYKVYNGDKVHVNIGVLEQSSSGVTGFYVNSTLNGVTHTKPIVVQD